MLFSFSGKGFDFPLGERTYIMGILNITRDSFFDGGRYTDISSQLKRAKQMSLEGADIIDVGAQSTRPGHVKKTDSDEIALLKPLLKEFVRVLVTGFASLACDSVTMVTCFGHLWDFL